MEPTRFKAALGVTPQTVFDYLEGYYNRQRLHSALGYRTPEQVEQVERRAA